MRIDSVVSHADWFQAYGSFGTPSVHRILDLLQDAGIRTIHWRTLFGARAKYQSKLETVYWGGEGGGVDRPQKGELKGRMAYDLREWDPLKDFVTIAKQAGFKTSGWYTLHEESHFQRSLTRFATENPDLWVAARDGSKRDSKVSFSSEKVRAHKLALMDEQLAYGLDSILLDFYRETHSFNGGAGMLTPGVQVDDAGVNIYGYEKSMVDAFRKTTGKNAFDLPNDDPEWLDFRVQQTTDFMAAARKAANVRKAEISVRVRSMGRMRMPLPWWQPEHAPTNSLRGSFVDWPTWAKKGYVDEVMLNLDNWDLGQNMSIEKIWDETKAARALIGDSAKLIIGFFCYDMQDRPIHEGAELLEAYVGAAIRAGADGVCLWESSSIHQWACAPVSGGKDVGIWPTVAKLAAEKAPTMHA